VFNFSRSEGDTLAVRVLSVDGISLVFISFGVVAKKQEFA
jgi:hypothetical protein